MYSKLFLAVFVLSVICAGASAQTPERYKYLVEATNRISEATAQSAAPNREALLRVTAEGCKALTQLLEDKQFQSDLFRLGEIAPSTRQARAEMKRELDLFVASFLRVEEQWLRRAGLNERAAKEVLWSASMFRNMLDEGYNPKYTLETILKLRSEMCDGARKLQEAQDDAKRFAIVRKWAFRVGGVLLVVVDVTAAAPGGPVAVGSAIIGASVAGWTE